MNTGIETYGPDGSLLLSFTTPVTRLLYDTTAGYGTEAHTDLLIATVPEDILGDGQVFAWLTDSPAPAVSAPPNGEFIYVESLTYSIVNGTEVRLTNTTFVNDVVFTILVGVRV